MEEDTLHTQVVEEEGTLHKVVVLLKGIPVAGIVSHTLELGNPREFADSSYFLKLRTASPWCSFV